MVRQLDGSLWFLGEQTVLHARDESHAWEISRDLGLDSLRKWNELNLSSKYFSNRLIRCHEKLWALIHLTIYRDNSISKDREISRVDNTEKSSSCLRSVPDFYKTIFAKDKKEDYYIFYIIFPI